MQILTDGEKYGFIYRVIRSCENIEHLETCANWVMSIKINDAYNDRLIELIYDEITIMNLEAL